MERIVSALEENPHQTSSKSGRITPSKMPSLLQEKPWKPSSLKRWIPAGKTVSSGWAWLHRIYDGANQRNREIDCGCGKKGRGYRASRSGSWRNSRINRHHTRWIKRTTWWTWVVLTNKLTLDNLAESRIFKTAFDFLYNTDPSMIWSLKPKQMQEGGLVFYRKLFREVKKEKKANYGKYISVKLHLLLLSLFLPPAPLSPINPFSSVYVTGR